MPCSVLCSPLCWLPTLVRHPVPDNMVRFTCLLLILPYSARSGYLFYAQPLFAFLRLISMQYSTRLVVSFDAVCSLTIIDLRVQAFNVSTHEVVNYSEIGESKGIPSEPSGSALRSAGTAASRQCWTITCSLPRFLNIISAVSVLSSVGLQQRAAHAINQIQSGMRLASSAYLLGV